MREGHIDHADELRVAHEQIAADLQSIGGESAVEAGTAHKDFSDLRAAQNHVL